MSDENRAAAGSDNGKGVARRVGDAERDDAVALLGEHWHAGRLYPGEQELRVTRAKAVVTQADLDALFVDLPGTDPSTPPESGGTVAAAGRGVPEQQA